MAIYVTAIDRRVITTHAFVKKTQRTPGAAMELAARQAQEIAMTSLAKLKQRLLTDLEVRAEYDRLGHILTVVREMIEAARLTQAEVVARMGTIQSVIARLETDRHMPTFDLVAPTPMPPRSIVVLTST